MRGDGRYHGAGAGGATATGGATTGGGGAATSPTGGKGCSFTAAGQGEEGSAGWLAAALGLAALARPRRRARWAG
jgi:MYXO-CTERM domain-containing protein